MHIANPRATSKTTNYRWKAKKPIEKKKIEDSNKNNSIRKKPGKIFYKKPQNIWDKEKTSSEMVGLHPTIAIKCIKCRWFKTLKLKGKTQM